MSRLELHIHGMDCAEEVSLLRRALASRAGIGELSFDVMQSKLTVTHDAAQVTPHQIQDWIAAAGMRAEPWNPNADPRPWQPYLRPALAALSGLSIVIATLAGYLQSGTSLWQFLFAESSHAQGWPLLFHITAVLLGFGPSVPKAAASARALRPDLSLLMAISLTGAAVLGEWSEAATLAFLYATAGLLETWSLRKAQSSVAALLQLTPAEATVVHHDHEHRTPVSRIAVGERVRVRPGERIPCDGIVLEGESTVDQAIITGEAAPVFKRPGDTVFAGTMNQSGGLELRTTSEATDTALARIVRMVEGSQQRRAPSEHFIERFARYYTPVILALAVAVALFPPLLAGADAARWFYQGMVVLLISCPCALVISTPVTIVSALASAARRGVLVKGGAYLEDAARLKAVAFDKTGVLTNGTPTVDVFRPVNGKPAAEILASLAGLESRSEHPLAAAIVQYARQQGVEPFTVEHFQARSGRGAEAAIGAHTFWAGNWRFCEDKHTNWQAIQTQLEQLEDSSHTAVLCGSDQEVWALIGLRDPLRSCAPQAIADLRRHGVNQFAILTGDNAVTANAVGKELGITRVHAELLPAEKQQIIQQLRERNGTVAMVGDGINDAQAMAAASIGIALAGRSTDLALETADVVLSSGDLRSLPFLLVHARRAVGIIRQNVGIAIGLKVAFLLMALLGKATLWMAIVADMGATILVTLNGLRMLRSTYQESRSEN
ncbi:MAG: cation-translocating P-type ATPase [Bryobacterales bacterium]|nr:cation-translocating P-type ATPase [Bryobacterales bacterium]